MKFFKEYITEAAISSANFEKATQLFVKLLQKKMSTKFYRFGGETGFVETKKGRGILYVYNRNKAIRFNHNGKSLNSLTLWNKFALGKKGDFTVNVEDMNVVQAFEELYSIIVNPRVQNTPIHFLGEETMLTEAKRISPAGFYALVDDNLFPGENIGKLSRERINKIAANAGVSVPTVVNKLATGRGDQKTFDLTRLLSVDKANEVSKSVEPIYFIKVTAQDPDTKRFVSVKGDASAQSILKTIDSAVNNPSKEQISQMKKDPNTLFGHMKSLTQVVARGKRNSLVITGGAGIGKSHTVFETLQEEGLTKNKDWYLIKGKITTASLYQTLYLHRNDTLLVFDDADSVWGDGDAANILKAALDSYDKRYVSWLSARTVNVSKMSDDDKEEYYASTDLKLQADPGDPRIKLPSEFEYRGRIIFISNLPQSKMDSAVLNRSTKIDMDLTTEEIFTRIESILPMIGDKSVDIEAKREILDFIKQNSRDGKLDAPSIRTFVGAEDLYKSGLPNWRELMEYI